MTERKPIRSEEELAEAFDQLFSEIPSPRSRTEIDKYIIEAGIDPDEFGLQIKESAIEALQTSPLNWRNQQTQAEIKEARAQLDKIGKIAKQDRSRLLELIDNALEKLNISNPNLAPVHYRNKSDLSEEDLTSLLQELVFIAEKEKIELDLGD